MKNQKPALFFDFDGFQFYTLPLHVSYINKKYGIETKPEDYLQHLELDILIKKHLPQDRHAFIVHDDVYSDLGENMLTSIELHESVIPMEGMCEVLPLLAEKYQLWTVTARQTSGIRVIEYLLNKYVPNCTTGIHCVWEPIGNNKFRETSKKEFILNFKGEKIAFLDDSPTEISKVQDILPSYLYDPRGIYIHLKEINHRVESWKQIGEIFI